MVQTKQVAQRGYNSRTRAWRTAAGVLLVAAVATGVYGTFAGSPALARTATAAPVAQATAPGLYDNLSDLQLLDQEGRDFRPAALQGKVVLLNFVFTGCSATCPTQTRELAALQRALPASLRRDVRFISISVDPLGDTPALLRAYGKSAGADFSSWTFATGRPQDIARLDERLRLFRTADARPEDHTTSLWLIDGNGRLMQRYVGVGIDKVRVADDIAQVWTLRAVPG